MMEHKQSNSLPCVRAPTTKRAPLYYCTTPKQFLEQQNDNINSIQADATVSWKHI